ncbi:MAG TPA: tripartite tricarboxylate transporter TctB family protein [Aurantimonas sp.]|uniref:Tripartite tricarboxylate transporter TctB family protein n=1 Tax=Aurantimonas marianensis TaxID=2920428 RepID=A0A9X2KEG4_9HYPH|nr:tripartite tricarboxylate transporter TctB family protein [Aurantimonas marianensis]MCP3054431.1 tripartite tricarboxylate transporter TctB family protein [Aurantimonas marianensis]
MRNGATRRVVDWGHLGFLAFIGGVVLTYLFDARAVSLKINNLLLVQPAAIIALVLIACVLPQCFKRRSLDDGRMTSDARARENDPAIDPDAAGQRRGLIKVAALAALLGIFTYFLEAIGFDVATFLFMAFGLVLCGERKWWVVLLFSAAFTLFVVYGYSTLVPYPFPMRIL